MDHEGLQHDSLLMALKPQPSESVASTLGFEHGLCDDKPELSSAAEVLIHARVDKEHRNVLLASAKPARRPGEGEQPVALPQRLHSVSVIAGQAFPVYPGRIAGNVVHPANEQRGKIVFDDPGPDAVLVFLIEANQLPVKADVGWSGGDGQPLVLAAREEFSGCVTVLDAVLKHLGVLRNFLRTARNLLRDEQVRRFHGAARNLGHFPQACEQVSVLGRGHDRIAQIDRDLDAIDPSNQVLDRHQVVGPRGHDGQGVQIESHNVGQNLLEQISFVVGALLAVRVIPAADSVDRHHQKCARTASRVQQALVRIALVAKLVQHVLSQPVRRVILAQVVPDRFWKQLLVELLEQVAGLRRVFRERVGVVFVQLGNHLPGEFFNRGIPGREIPREQVALEEVGDS